MKYFSFVDNLNLNISDLIDFSPYTLKSLTEHLSDLDENKKIQILNSLNDLALRSYHITIEKNIWLKNLLLQEYYKLNASKINLTLEDISYVSGFKLFLEPYLIAIIPDFIDYCFKKSELKLLFKVLNSKDLYSKACENSIVTLFKNKVKYALRILKNQESSYNYDTVDYIKNYHFYKTLNLYTPQLDNDVIKLYDRILEYVLHFQRTDDPKLKFLLHAQIAFKSKEVDDVATKLLIDDNAEIAMEDTFKDSSDINETKSNLVGLMILAISSILILIFIFYSATTAKDIPNEITEESTNKSERKKRKTDYDNRIQFYYSLKLLASKKAFVNDTNSVKTNLVPFSNPYPKTFNHLHGDHFAPKKNKIIITNNSDFGLIVFKLIKGKDRAIYIPEKSETNIKLNPSDSLLFITGNDFVKSKFSHFSNNMALSDIYEIQELKSSETSRITLIQSELNLDSVSIEISEKSIQFSDNLLYKKISVDNLYRNYFFKQAN